MSLAQRQLTAQQMRQARSRQRQAGAFRQVTPRSITATTTPSRPPVSATIQTPRPEPTKPTASQVQTTMAQPQQNQIGRDLLPLALLYLVLS